MKTDGNEDRPLILAVTVINEPLLISLFKCYGQICFKKAQIFNL